MNIYELPPPHQLLQIFKDKTDRRNGCILEYLPGKLYVVNNEKRTIEAKKFINL